jgi:hypothetical protein
MASISRTSYTLGCLNSVTPFAYSGAALNQPAQFKVINFDPTGVARIAPPMPRNCQCGEIDLLTTHGTAPSPTPTPFNQDVDNHAAIQIAPMSGEIRVYRP